MRLTNICNREPEKFVSCRVGLELVNYEDDPERALIEHKICGTRTRSQQQQQSESYDTGNATGKGNFMLIPIASPRSQYYDINPDNGGLNLSELLPDLALDRHRWENEVAVTIGNLPYFSSDSNRAIATLDMLFLHALYLPTNVIVINVPPARSAHQLFADVINKRLQQNRTQRLVLIRIPLQLGQESLLPNRAAQERAFTSLGWFNRPPQSYIRSTDYSGDTTSESGFDEKSYTSFPTCEGSGQCDNETLTGWDAWNSVRSHLVPDHRIGVCLAIEEEIEHNLDEVAKWRGEPVRLVTLGMDKFCSMRGVSNLMRPIGGIKEFLKMITTHNSLTTGLVLQGQAETDVQLHLDCLSQLCDFLASEYPDSMRAWDDTPLDPLQPLSSNLDSNTYQIFEADRAKYNQYHDAMFVALNVLLKRTSSRARNRLILMVLGAGRGPLVDAMIAAIEKLSHKSGKTFAIYALDKNKSSIVSLRYKQACYWDRHRPLIETHVVEADMRDWFPEEKADLITTELLGSFSDNELSPECIDGTWRFSTNQTICIPQRYNSYLTPIMSYRMRQELHKMGLISRDTHYFDRIQVIKLTNYYRISVPQVLFSFEHARLGKRPVEGANLREKTLVFSTHVDVVVHGFAGYFSSNLFGGVTISTVPEFKTRGMDSWFPVFIPIEEPIELPAHSELEVRFSRKESADKVWYEWKTVRPQESRVHNKDGIGSAMSKIV